MELGAQELYYTGFLGREFQNRPLGFDSLGREPSIDSPPGEKEGFSLEPPLCPVAQKRLGRDVPS